MKLITDVDYQNDHAIVAGLLFDDWSSDEIHEVVVKGVDDVAPYVPGSFYLRELPCLLALLEDISMPLDLIIVDGFVSLGSDQRAGLGMHLYEALDGEVPVIGVAKTAFKDSPAEMVLYRGISQTPLYVSSVGLSLDEAKGYIAEMHGEHRIPTLVKKVDQYCRGILGGG